jgi:sortase A
MRKLRELSKEQWRFLLIRTVGNFLVLSSLLAMFLTFGPAIKNEVVYRYERLQGIKYVVSTDNTAGNITGNTGLQIPNDPGSSIRLGRGSFKDVIDRDKNQNGSQDGGYDGNQDKNIRVLTPVDTDFGIIIPKIAANAKVVPLVDAGNYDSYMKALKIGVAHAQGTRFPGEGGNIYLFAHSTDNFWNVGRYNAIFYLLKELDKGDEVDLFYQGRRYVYKTTEKKIVESSDTQYLTEISGSEQVTLQTCWPPGTTLKRLIIIAKPLKTNLSSVN